MGGAAKKPGGAADTASAKKAARKRGFFARLPLRYRIALLAPVLALLAGSCALSLALITYTIRFPDPMSLRKQEASPVVRILARDGSLLAERGQAYDFVPLDLLPRHLIDAVVATEDHRFFDHRGLDPVGLVRAMFANLRAGRIAQGGSTLTQQLAKNLFLSSERTMGRKLEELLLALWLEVRLSKQDILELYLNRVYFGGGAYGVEAAARRYFDKPARALSLSESAIIAGLLKAPSRFSPTSSQTLAMARARVVLQRMVAARLITPADVAATERRPVRFADAGTSRDASGVEYAVDFVLDHLPPLAGNDQHTLVVETTFDAHLQKRAQAQAEALLARDGQPANATQAAIVVLDTDGGIRALVGGRSFAKSQYNRAVKARRQPGSAFKPIVYLAAVEQGLGPESLVLDMPITINNWSPRNENGQNRGAMTLRHALAHSVNTVAVRLQQDIGTKRVLATARRLGIKSELKPSPSLALGTGEVSLLELTGAFTVLASGGAAVHPHAIERVRTGNGRIVYARPPQRPSMIVAPDHVATLTSMLASAVSTGTGRRAALARHAAAGKTGTTQDFRDAWFVGYTAHLAAGVWIGNDAGEPMTNVMGGNLPAQLWRAVMTTAHERLLPAPLPGSDLVRPDGSPPTSVADPVDTLNDADRALTSADAPAEARRSPSHAAGAPRAKTAVKRPQPKPVASPAPAPVAVPPPRLPQQSIDPGLFADALAEPSSADTRQEASAATKPSMLDRLKRHFVSSGEARMGLGVTP